MKWLAVVVLSVWTALTVALTAHAQSVTTIFSFNGTNGTQSYSGLTLGPDGNFYGATGFGGTGNYGTVFKVKTDGTLTTLVNFNNTNGANPYASLTLGPDGNFYGTTHQGGSANDGTIFQMTTNGALTTLVNFNGANGSHPHAALMLGPDGNFYGTTLLGGSANHGTVFKLTTTGTLTTLVNFNSINGASPYGPLLMGPGGNIYGTTFLGGNTNDGTVFQLATNGALTTLVSFNGADGAQPQTGLALGPDCNFYGTTYADGSSNHGTVFQMTSDGTLTTLINFNGFNGYAPFGTLALAPDGNFYGTCIYGGSGAGQYGTIFKITTAGTLTTLVAFNSTNGANPHGELMLGQDGNFYGTTEFGGSAGDGTIFRLNLPPEFISAPVNQTAVIGGSATFGCQMFGTAPYAYQWLSNGVPITGATNATLSFSPALANAIGSYQVVVTNAFGSVTSSSASLNVLMQPNIYAIFDNGTGNFTVSLASLPNSTNRLWVSTDLVQWQVIATNVMDGNGLCQFLDTNTVGMPQKFYRLSYP